MMGAAPERLILLREFALYCIYATAMQIPEVFRYDLNVSFSHTFKLHNADAR